MNEIVKEASYTILVVDDSRLQRMLLSGPLKRDGFKVLEAESGVEALEILHRETVHIVVSDWMMPGMSGVELCRKVRQSQKGTYIYFILVTSKNQRSDLLVGFDGGIDDYIARPLDMAELSARIMAGVRVVNLQVELSAKNQAVEVAHDEMSKTYDELRSDLSAAAQFLESLIPPDFKRYAGAGVACMFKPSHLLGGDILGCFPLHDGKLAVYSIDVSGHGVSSALLSVMLSQAIVPPRKDLQSVMPVIDGEAMPVHHPLEMVKRLNQSFQAEESSDLYFTICYAVIDLKTGEVRLCQAGHPNPAIIRAAGGVEMVGVGGFPVGLFAEAEFDEISFMLESGDRLMLYTDGLTEAENHQGEQLNEGGLCDVLEQLEETAMSDFGPVLREKLEDYTAGCSQLDDLSALIVSYDGCLANCPRPCGTDFLATA